MYQNCVKEEAWSPLDMILVFYSSSFRWMLVWNCLEWSDPVTIPLHDGSFQAQGDSFLWEGTDKLLCFGRKRNSSRCRRNRQDIFLEYTKARDYLYSSLWGTNQHNSHLLNIVNKYWLFALCQPWWGTWRWRFELDKQGFFGCLPKLMRDRYLVKAGRLKSGEEVGCRELQECLRKWDACLGLCLLFCCW